jgi:hypothetical protein
MVLLYIPNRASSASRLGFNDKHDDHSHAHEHHLTIPSSSSSSSSSTSATAVSLPPSRPPLVRQNSLRGTAVSNSIPWTSVDPLHILCDASIHWMNEIELQFERHHEQSKVNVLLWSPHDIDEKVGHIIPHIDNDSID